MAAARNVRVDAIWADLKAQSALPRRGSSSMTSAAGRGEEAALQTTPAADLASSSGTIAASSGAPAAAAAAADRVPSAAPTIESTRAAAGEAGGDVREENPVALINQLNALHRERQKQEQTQKQRHDTRTRGLTDIGTAVPGWMRAFGLLTQESSNQQQQQQQHQADTLERRATAPAAAPQVADGAVAQEAGRLDGGTSAAAPMAAGAASADGNLEVQQQQQQQERRQELQASHEAGSEVSSSIGSAVAAAAAAAAAAALAAVKAATGVLVSEENAIEVKEVRTFAGEAVEVSRVVAADSKAALAAKRKAEMQASSSRGLDALLASMEKKKKLSILDKTRKDWGEYKAEAGVVEELEEYKRSGTTYTEKVDFLTRADVRQFEKERDIRLATAAAAARSIPPPK